MRDTASYFLLTASNFLEFEKSNYRLHPHTINYFTQPE